MLSVVHKRYAILSRQVKIQVRYISHFKKQQTKYNSLKVMHNAPDNSHILTPHLLSLMPAEKQKQPCKKNQKGQRMSSLQHPLSELEPKNTRKNQENIPKRANEAKPVSQGKKVKKKVVPQRIIPTPQPQMERRIKTQGPWQGEGGSLKKQKRAHVKSVSQGSKMPIGKKERTVKSKTRDKHAKSCQIYGVWKRLPDVDHTISQAGPFKRKRTPSHFACNDKVLTRLLNVSLLASQIGASPLVTSDRRSSQPSHSKTFKECLNSIDLRILRSLHDDVPAFAVREAGPDAVRAVMLRNQLSLEQLTKRVTLIQRCWRKRQRNSVINTYKRLFQRATDNFFRQDKIADVSAIDIDIDRSESFELDSLHNQKLADLHQSQKSQGSMLGSLQEGEDYRHRWIHESQENGDGLNIGKYRQLVQEEIRNLNKQVGVQKQGRGGLDSKYLLEELMRHNFSKKWIDQESSSLSDRQNPNPNPSVDQLTPSTFPKLSRNEEDEPSLDDSQVYDRNKYEMNSLEESEGVVPAKMEQTAEKKRETIDIQWINSQLHDQIIVKNYLDCGLEKFTMHAQKQQERQGSSDQAIGERFQRANIAILRRRQQRKAVAQLPTTLGKEQAQEVVSLIVNGLLDEFAVGTPLSNQDISAILKKCNAALPQRKPQPAPPRPAGIQTGFQSIFTYVDKLTHFAKDREDVITRITANINKDIGPSSLEILSYLRPELEDTPPAEQSQDIYDEQGLFVVPAELFEEFQSQLQGEFKQKEQKEMGPRVKAYLSFWNRCIFQSYNECLDYERPFGVEGRPYDWLKERKVFRPVTRSEVAGKMEKARQRLLEGSGVVAGVLPQNAGEPFDEQQLHMANQERLSRILAVELLENESAWINYNDEMAELLVQLSRVIEERLFFQFSGGEVKRLLRTRRILAQQYQSEQSVQFSLEDLQ